MSTITIDQMVYKRAEEYAKMHNLSLPTMVEELLKSVISANPQKSSLTLPARWEKLCGILKGVKDENDERFNYIINK